MENTKKLINKLIITMIISSILFYTIEVNFAVYFSIILALWILMFLNYKMSKNMEFFDTVIMVSLGNLISYVLLEEIIYSGFKEGTISLIYLASYLIFLLIISISSFILHLNNKKTVKESQELIGKRKRDLDELLYYVDMFDIVGLNGRWGTGKSFLINELENKLKDEYEFIEIDILSCNLDELQLILIKEIEDVMYKNRIISKYSNKLKGFLADESSVSKFQNLIFSDNKSYSETIKGFKEELSKMDKKIIIIYEDIDRITDENIIKNIFGISEKLSGKRVKIIYQYYEDNLKDIGFTDDYLEKYIPFKMNLTELNFFEVLDFKLKENNYDKSLLDMKDFDFLRGYSQDYRYKVLSNEFGMDTDMNLIITNISMRKVENFLAELSKILSKGQYEGHKEIIISFFIIKHFIPVIYGKLNIEEGLLETIKFKTNSKEYTMPDLISMYHSKKLSREEIEDIFQNKENRMNYCILKLFDYKHNQVIDQVDYKERLRGILEEPVNILKDRNSNDKKDRLIWSLLAPGKSEYTDYEYAGNKLIEEVLGKENDKQIKAYSEFWESLYNLNSNWEDNTTIFKMGIPQFIELFKAFRILDVEDHQQIGLIDLYFAVEGVEDFNYEVIQTINYCELKTSKGYIYILKKLNSLKLVGNLNSEKGFYDFLRKYIRGLSKFGYIDTAGYLSIIGDGNILEYERYVIKDLKRIIERIGRLRDKLDFNLKLSEAEDELNTIIKFMEKLIEIISCEYQAIKKEYGGIRTNMTSRFTNQEEFDRLKAMGSGDYTEAEIKKSFSEGKITIYELDKLIDEWNGEVKGSGAVSH